MLGKRTEGRRQMQMLHDLTVNSDYVTLKQTAAERTMWRYGRGYPEPALQQKTEKDEEEEASSISVIYEARTCIV